MKRITAYFNQPIHIRMRVLDLSKMSMKDIYYAYKEYYIISYTLIQIFYTENKKLLITIKK